MDNENYKKLQEMLPDYVFNRLESSDKLFFESNVQNYPDLIEEINQVKAVFNRFDKMEFEDKINHKARNFSVKVMEKREKRRSYKFSGGQYLVRYLVPIAVLIAIGMYYMGTPKLQKNDITKDIENKVAAIGDSLNNYNVEEEVLKNSEQYSSVDILSNNLETIYEDEISDALNEMIDISEVNDIETFDADIFSSDRVLKTVNDLDEDKFQELYMELKNVKLID